MALEKNESGIRAPIEPGQIYRRNENFIFRRIEGETVLVPIRGHVGDLESIYSLNPVAARIWESLDGSRSLAAVRELITAEFEVAAAEAEADLLALIGELKTIEAVMRVAG